MTETPIEEPLGERILDRPLVREMKESYLTYALSVIHSRALPDVRDGLKPSQRRILVAMNDLNLSPRSRYRKCAKVAGDTSGNYHPHGESVIYPTLVRMAQDFSMRYPLVDGQGNFGSIDADPPAAMRYTEARMTGISMEMMSDLEKETVDLEPNYDDTRTQPTVLPSRFPNLICNGSEGIAVGMATSMPPHNLREVCAGIRAILANPFLEDMELIKLIPGPDFPTGGIIMGRSGIMQAYTTGRGLVRVRGRYHVEEPEKGPVQVVFTEIPYQTRKGGDSRGSIINKIAEAVKEERIVGIRDIVDLTCLSKETGGVDIRLTIQLKKGEDPNVIVNQLFKYTPLQSTYSIINLAISERQPRTLTLRQLLDSWIAHRRGVIRKRTSFLLRKAEEREHIVDGLLVAQANIDKVIELIRNSADRDGAKEALSAGFGLSDRQAQAIVDMRLGSLTGLELEKLQSEAHELGLAIADLRDILANEERVTDILLEDLEDVEKRYGDERRTEISNTELDSSIDIGALITEDLMVVTYSREGYVKRSSLDTYRAQARGGQGVKGSDSKEGDILRSLFVAGTHDNLLFFTNRGQVFTKLTYELPEGSRTSKGRAMTNVLKLREGERVETILRVPSFDDEAFAVFATRKGRIKKTMLDAYSRPRSNGLRAIVLEEDDEVVGVSIAKPGDTIILSTAFGRAVRFDEAAARPMGRVSRGVKGARLRPGDRVMGLVVVDPDAYLLTATQNGFGKRTAMDDYPIKGRGTGGVIDIRTTERNGPVITALLCRPGGDVIYITEKGMIVRSHVDDISVVGRNTQGVRLLRLKTGDRLVAAQIIDPEDLERFAEEGEAEAPPEPDATDLAEGAAEPEEDEDFENGADEE
jgi:DNA gyrase subunit A